MLLPNAHKVVFKDYCGRTRDLQLAIVILATAKEAITIRGMFQRNSWISM